MRDDFFDLCAIGKTMRHQGLLTLGLVALGLGLNLQVLHQVHIAAAEVGGGTDADLMAGIARISAKYQACFTTQGTTDQWQVLFGV